MLLTVDVVACVIQFSIKSGALACADVSVGPGKSLVDAYSRLLRFKPFGFPAIQLAAANALPDPFLLMIFALVYPSLSRQRSGADSQNKQRYHKNLS